MLRPRENWLRPEATSSLLPEIEPKRKFPARRIRHARETKSPHPGASGLGGSAAYSSLSTNRLWRPATAACTTHTVRIEEQRPQLLRRRYTRRSHSGSSGQPGAVRPGPHRGFDARGIWVDRGCRADFQVNPYKGTPNWGNPGPGHRPPKPGGPNWGNSGACFYKEAGFGGEYFCMRRGESYNNLPPGYNDRISAIRVFGGAEVSFYNDSNYGGRRASTRRDVANLKNWRTADDPTRTWNDRISSFQVR